MRRIVIAGALLATPLSILAIAPAQGSTPASALTCYRVGFQRTPSAQLRTNPIGVAVDDGDPYISKDPGGC